MIPVDFSTAALISCAPGNSKTLPQHLRALKARKILLVTDMGVHRAGLLNPVLEDLVCHVIEPKVFDGVEADPSAQTVLAAAQAARAFGAQAIVGLGGGSPMDVAKVAALLAASDQPLDGTFGVGNAAGPRLPLILIPTTAGTGSEVTPIAIVTVGAERKQGIVSPHLLPDVALLDPALTHGLPKHITAATGIDAMVHAIEAYTSAHKKNPVSDALACKALEMLARGVPAAYDNGQDMDARSDALLGASMAGMAFANAPVAAVHALAYPIGARFHVPHGVSNALVLPQVLRFNLPAAETLYGELAPLICTPAEITRAQTPAAAFVKKLEDLCDQMGVPRRLGDVGIHAGDIPQLARDAMEQTRLLVNNPRPVTEADAAAIYEATL